MPTIVPHWRTSATSGIARDRFELLREQLDLRLQALQRPLPLEGLEAGQSRRAGERVAGVGVAVEEGPLLRGGPEEAVVDPLGGQRRRQRHVPPVNPLQGRANRGRRPPARRRTSSRCRRIRSPPRRGSDARRSGRSARAPRKGTRGMDQDPGRAQQQRLEDHRRDLLLVTGEDPLQIGGIARLRRMRLEEQRPVGRVEEVDAADRARAIVSPW